MKCYAFLYIDNERGACYGLEPLNKETWCCKRVKKKEPILWRHRGLNPGSRENKYEAGCEEKRKIAWVAWQDVCKPKVRRGLGLKDINLFNLRLLGKWKKRLLTDNEALWSRILLARYGQFLGRNTSAGQPASSASILS